MLLEAMERKNPMISICQTAGVADRTYRDWRDGSRPTAQFDTADLILTRLGLCWWEVFNEDTCRRPVIVATRYARRNSSGKGRRPRVRREIVGTTRYGDLGPDMETLATVEFAFTGEDQGEQLEMAA
jgi:hypothetical protein